MARVVFCGFETGALLAEPTYSATFQSAVVGSATIESSIVRSGQYSLKATPASGAAGYFDLQSGSTFGVRWLRFYVRITVLPGTARILFGSNGATLMRLTLNTTGTITIGDGTLTATSTTALSDTSRWYRLEVESVGGGDAILYIDGVNEASIAGAGAAATAFRFGAMDTVAATYTAYFDDFVGDNAANGGPTDSHLVMVLPVSDNSRTNWTAGAGGTTNLWDAVNNRPPAGLASASETDTSNIESANSSGTANYIANMQTYLEAGVGPYDLVKSVMLVLRHGEDVGTGTKNWSIESTANPVIAAVTGLFGDSAGTHAGEVGVWRTTTQGSAGPIANLPALSMDTRPTMKVIKTDTGTRTGCVDFMGFYVEFILGPMISRPKTSIYPQLLAH